MDMKKLLFIFLILSSVGCKDDDEMTPYSSTPKPTVLTLPIKGDFISAPNETVKGSAQIVDDKGARLLIFNDAFMANGPDLKVYLSTDAVASDYTSLGSVKAASGMQTYSVANNIDLLKYRFVVIWCEEFSVRFGTAELK
jgi:hypothetical protein